MNDNKVYLPTVQDYLEVIKALPEKKKYTREDLLISELLVDQKGNMEMYYAAHNEYINPMAKVFMLGITPGFSQMEQSILACKEAIRLNEPIAYWCKKKARFAGPLRKNISDMLDALDLNRYLGLHSTSELFEQADQLLHTTSLIPYATFVKGKNYSGHGPELRKDEWMMGYVNANLERQVHLLKDALYIPMGRSVEEVLKSWIKEGSLREDQCLLGFPHPSGANVNRKKQFDEEKSKMMFKISQFYS